MAKADLTAARLRELLHYDPETGVFTWLHDQGRAVLGSPAGSLHCSGYLVIGIDGHDHKAHRLAWLAVYGDCPSGSIDHINGIKNDNRLSNLRDIHQAQNCQNRQQAQANNKSCGLLGVTWKKAKNRWVASIKMSGKKIHIGYFDDPESAHAAYLKKKREIHSACTI